MGFFSNTITPSVAPKGNNWLVPGENIVRSFQLIFDELIFTDRRIIFTDGSALGTKRKTVSISYSKITAIEIEKGLSFAQEITIISGSKEWEFKSYNAEDGALIYSMLSERIF